MAEKREKSNDAAGRELVITRLLNAPKELVWEVFIKPEHIKNWWGPNGFTNTIDKMEVKPGGIWEFVMHGPDGRDYKNVNIFKEVIRPERIVFEHQSPKFITPITFTEEGKKTMLKWHMLFESKLEFEQAVKTYKADEGLKQNIEKLEKYLSDNRDLKTGTKTLTITRIFNAPVELVWKAWTDEKHVAQWWGPTGFTNPVCKWNAKAGNKIFIQMKAQNGTVYPMDGEFHEIIKNEKIVFTSAALDENDKRLFEVLNIITFSKQGDKTQLVLHFMVSNITREGAPYIAGQEKGWNLSLDRLANLLK